MIKKLQSLPGQSVSIACSALLIVASVVTALMWWQQLRISYADIAAHSYSLNKASGVHVSKFTDIREAVGTKSNSNAYGFYLGKCRVLLARQMEVFSGPSNSRERTGWHSREPTASVCPSILLQTTTTFLAFSAQRRSTSCRSKTFRQH